MSIYCFSAYISEGASYTTLSFDSYIATLSKQLLHGSSINTYFVNIPLFLLYNIMVTIANYVIVIVC